MLLLSGFSLNGIKNNLRSSYTLFRCSFISKGPAGTGENRAWDWISIVCRVIWPKISKSGKSDKLSSNSSEKVFTAPFYLMIDSSSNIGSFYSYPNWKSVSIVQSSKRSPVMRIALLLFWSGKFRMKLYIYSSSLKSSLLIFNLQIGH